MPNRELLSKDEERELNRLYTNIRLGEILRRLADAIAETHKEMDDSRDFAKNDWSNLSDGFKK